MRAKRFSWIPWMLLIGAIGMVLMVLNGAYSQYKRYYQLRLDPLEQEVFSQDKGFIDTTSYRIIFWGDSRAREWIAPVLPDSFAVVNRGVNTQTTAQCLLRAQLDLLQLNHIS